MANQERSFEAGGHRYTIRFTQNALYKLEREIGSLTRLDEDFGIVQMQTMLWAGLEGARLKAKERKEPFTIEEVGDLWDDMVEAGLKPIAIVMDAWAAAMAPREEAAPEGEANPPATSLPDKD